MGEPTREEIFANLSAWIHDLETTDAKQGRRSLRTQSDEYCCLGRACEAARAEWQIHDGNWAIAYEQEQEDDDGDDYIAVRYSEDPGSWVAWRNGRLGVRQ